MRGGGLGRGLSEIALRVTCVMFALISAMKASYQTLYIPIFIETTLFFWTKTAVYWRNIFSVFNNHDRLKFLRGESLTIKSYNHSFRKNLPDSHFVISASMHLLKLQFLRKHFKLKMSDPTKLFLVRLKKLLINPNLPGLWWGLGRIREIVRTYVFHSSNKRSWCTDYGYIKRFNMA